MDWSAPPRMEDMAELTRVAQEQPMETAARLECLRRELGEAIKEDPVRVANFGLTIEHGRTMLERQVRHALRMLAERQDIVEVLSARVLQLEARLVEVEGRQWRRPWWRWW